MFGWLAALLVAASCALALPVIANAKQQVKVSHGKRHPAITVHPKKRGKGDYGFLPGYRQPPDLTDWRERSPRHGGPRETDEWRYWGYDGELRYGWGWPRYYRGRWNGGSFGPCWTSTPIGMMWNCGQ